MKELFTITMLGLAVSASAQQTILYNLFSILDL